MAATSTDNETLGKALDKRLLRRLVVYLRPYRWHVIGSVVMAVAAALLGALRPYLTKEAIDNHLMKGDVGGMLGYVAAIVAALALQGIVQYLLTWMMQYVGQETIHTMRTKLFEHIQRLSLRFYDTTPVGRLVTRVTSDIEVLNEFFASGLVMIAANIFIIVCIIIMMFVMSVKLSLITLISLPLLLWATSIFRKKVRVMYREVRTQLSKMNSFINEQVTGIQTVKLFGQEKRTFQEFSEVNEAYTVAQVKSVFYYAVFFPVVDFLSSLAVALIIWYGGSAIISATPDFGLWGMIRGWFGTGVAQPLSFGVLFAFIQYTEMFFRPIRDLSDKYNILQSAMASSERIFELMDETSFAPTAENAEPFQVKGGAIEFKNIDFSYDGKHPVIQNLSFSVMPGETVAIVGATGAGKTSIINILMRFYEFSGGGVSIDGRDIRTIDVHELRRDIALVMQDVFLFRGTILENITLNNDRISRERAIEAARTVGVARFIESLPEKYDTPVQERGATLSVGQKQLLSFARALAHDPKILILDEATSSVDTETERLIQNATERLLEGRTSIVIAHRLSTIQNADKILVMHHGELREMGTHEQLLALGGIYSTLYNLQYKVQERIAAPAASMAG